MLSQDPANPPLAIHSLPSASTSVPSTSTPVLATAPPPTPDPDPPKASSSTAAAVLPKLVSVVEVVKRTFVALPPSALDAAGSVDATKDNGKGKAKETDVEPGQDLQVHVAKKRPKGDAIAVRGLHQYSRLGALEELGLAGPDAVDGGGEIAEKVRHNRIALEWIESGGGGTKRFVLPDYVVYRRP